MWSRGKEQRWEYRGLEFKSQQDFFYQTPAGHTAEKKSRRKRNRGLLWAVICPTPALPPLPPSPPPTPRICHTTCGYVIRVS